MSSLLNVQQIFMQLSFVTVSTAFFTPIKDCFRLHIFFSGIRPQIPESFEKDRLYGATIKNILIQSWDGDPCARINAATVSKRLQGKQLSGLGNFRRKPESGSERSSIA